MDAKCRALIGRFGLLLLALIALPSALRLLQWSAYGAMAMALGEIPTGGWILALGDPLLYSGWVDMACKWLCHGGLRHVGGEFQADWGNATLQGTMAFISAGCLSLIQILGMLFAHRMLHRWGAPVQIDARQACEFEARRIERSVRNPRTAKNTNPRL